MDLSGTHQLNLVLVEPEIPQNAGNVARLCAVTGVRLHLVRPLGFFLSDRHLKRAGMDYLEGVDLIVHDDLEALRQTMGNGRPWLFSARARRPLWAAEFQKGDWLVLGKESAGLPASWTRVAGERLLRIPMLEGSRSLNLSTAAGVVVYEALRQVVGLEA